MNVKIDLNSIMQVLGCTLQWLNNNQGVISVGIFVLTVAAGFVSGIFGKLRNKPKFIVDALQGPTFYCLFCNLKNKNSHRVAISLYLEISNVGSAPSDINEVYVGYHWDIIPGCIKHAMLRFGWFYLVDQTVALSDFQASIGDNIKIFPSLFQISQTNRRGANTYLKVGQSTVGVVYFEQSDRWGGYLPRQKNGIAKMKVVIRDAFGKSHTTKIRIELVSLEQAKKYNPAFGQTLDTLHGRDVV